MAQITIKFIDRMMRGTEFARIHSALPPGFSAKEGFGADGSMAKLTDIEVVTDSANRSKVLDVMEAMGFTPRAAVDLT